MRSGGARDKGAGFEKEICVFLSEWITAGERKDVFWRSAGSGSRSTTASARGEMIEYQASDIGPTHPAAFQLLDVFVIECKFYADLHLQDLPFPKLKSNIAVFWEQVIRDAGTVLKVPMLLAKQNRKPVLMGVPVQVLCAMVREVPALAEVPYVLTSWMGGGGMALLDFKAVFDRLQPNHLHNLLYAKEHYLENHAPPPKRRVVPRTGRK